MEYLYILREALVWIVTIFWLYQLLISLCSLIKIKDKPLKVKKDHKFMAIIPAHNEEAVVGNLIESLKNQNYNKDLYDIYVIADNCTDNTARVAKKAGAIVYERFDEAHKTKGHALQWFLAQKIEEDAPYDAFCIFDADNIVDENFLKVMNKKLCQGEEVVQGYKDIKNPSDSWVSAGYAIFYWTMHRFYHLARYNLGLSPLLNGTGFMVKFDVVKPNGWETQTLTEDIEFSLKQIIQGRKLGWATDAIVYDEQPVGFKQSWSQRSRWTVGHMQCIKEYTKQLGIPWGISEAAFNVKDLKSNYQYKAFGIPWLGLKRGLADELVVSSYGGILAILDDPKGELENLKRLEKEGMYDKYGFYESIDYTPERVEKGKTSSVVKTYMAHHQGLILLSINNLKKFRVKSTLRDIDFFLPVYA